ncbi:AmpG family muropeptide MFS transporter [Parvibaculum sp.]|uniref:AmpG family muropeptide MFS transporter n=1 Tax=Parvibaculum sp. TaxID=2024848 RepID=UPI00320F8FD9
MAENSKNESFARRFANAVSVYGDRQIFIMLLLGFSSGLPFMLVFGTMSAWLREAGVSRTEIGLMSYVGLAYTIKFLWAPLIDQIRLPWLAERLGKRRAWMIVAQALIALALVGISFCDPHVALTPIALFAVMLAFSSATQDISVDAWRIEAASDEKQGAMAAAYQLGYRLAIIASGAGALYVAQYVSWHAAYLAMAVLMCIGMGAALAAPRLADAPLAVIGEAAVEALAGRFALHGPLKRGVTWLYRAAVAPFVDFFGQRGWQAFIILALIGLYRLPDFVMGVMANPLYIDLGFSLATIATVVKVFGVWMTIAGAIVGGVSVARLGVLRSMLLGATAVALTNFLFSWLATRGGDVSALTIAIGAENFSGGFAATCLIAYMSSLTNHEFTATQYALFSSAYALPGKLLGGMSGIMVDWYGAQAPLRDLLIGYAPDLTARTAGYVPFFATTGLLGLPAVLLILYLLRRESTAPRKAESLEAAS